MIKISSLAKNKLIETIKNDNGKSIFLFLKGGGCNGFLINLKFYKIIINPIN